jgi:uncharacterized membrane protein
MLNAYNLLKFVHVISVILWLGAITTLSVLLWRLRAEPNRQIVSALVQQSISFGQRFVGPASGLVLLTGLAMVGIARIGFTTFWVLWGLTGIAIHFIYGAVILRKRSLRLAEALAPGTDDAAFGIASRRLSQAQFVYLLILASVIWAMVVKPTL